MSAGPTWRKLGLVCDASKAGVAWMKSHCQLPVADRVDGDVYRVYFAARDGRQISRVGCAMVELGEGVRLLEISTAPLLEPGATGTFDEHGVFPSCIVDLPDRKRMYYVGWNRGVPEPLFYAAIGLAESTDGGRSWRKHSAAPILSRSEFDPCLVTSPHVLRHAGRWRMTYVSGVRWEESQSYYHIKYAESDDGLNWRREGRVAIDFASSAETNVARPWVLAEEGRLRMWFCYARKGSAYRIGYAESNDYLRWKRDDAAAGISVSESGWDSEMVCYPNVVRHAGRHYMFYNGNRFGADGFGAAVAD